VHSLGAGTFAVDVIMHMDRGISTEIIRKLLA